jgi:hypothetical protein
MIAIGFLVSVSSPHTSSSPARGPHGIVNGPDDVGAFRKIKQRRESGALRLVENSLRLIIGFANSAPPTGLAGELCFGLGEFAIGVAQEDQAEHGNAIFVRPQIGIRA